MKKGKKIILLGIWLFLLCHSYIVIFVYSCRLGNARSNFKKIESSKQQTNKNQKQTNKTNKKQNRQNNKQNARKKQAKKTQPAVADTVHHEKCGINSFFFSVDR